MHNYINFYKSCYSEDKSRRFIQNILSKDVELQLFIDDHEDLLTGLLPFRHLDSEYAKNLDYRSYLYRQEKEIVYSSLFLIGKHLSESNEKTILCSPLVFQNAKIVKEEDKHHLEQENNTIKINTKLLEFICDNPEHIEQINNSIFDLTANNNVFNTSEAGRLGAILDKISKNVDTTEIIRYPDLISEAEFQKKFRAIKRKQSSTFEILSISVLALMKKYSDAHGIMKELDEMSKMDSFSAPLHELFSKTKMHLNIKRGNGYVPSILSQAQERSLNSATNNTSTLLIGPPGTGKSYTIASLAMSYFNMGRSVLIVSGRDEAVDVIANKIEEQLAIKSCVVRAGKREYLKKLKQFLEDLLHGIIQTEVEDTSYLYGNQLVLKDIRRDLNKLVKKLKKRTRLEINNGKNIYKKPKNILQRLFFWYSTRLYESRKPLWELYSELDFILNRQVELIRTIIKETHRSRLDQSIRKYRLTIKTFLKAIRARTGGKKENLFGVLNLSILFKIFPIWLVKLSDLGRVLPLEKELFDLVIIDEATQCDIASCLPAIYRAKRVVITGDPKQLRHVSFLSTKKQIEFLQNNGLTDVDEWDYRKKSILDLYSDRLNDQKCVHFLNEHFRSLPKIIAFSNSHFYNNRLNIMTEKPVNYDEDSVKIIPCSGTRNKSGINEKECSKIIDLISELLKNKTNENSSIGILSPFRNQVDYISNKLNKKFNISLLQKRNLLIGTAHTFQGEERDIMLLSFVVDSSSPVGVLRFLEKPDVFNVSVTRAKNLLHSMDVKNLAPNSLLRKFIQYNEIKNKENTVDSKNEVHDEFAMEVSVALQEKKIKAYIARPVAGFMLDIVAVNATKSIGIDLIGYPGDFEEVYSLDRYKMFKRAGFEIFPLPYMSWKRDRELCIENILLRLN